jgi:hypothetical protein
MKFLSTLLVVTSWFAGSSALASSDALLPGQAIERGRLGSFYPVQADDPPAGFRRAICGGKGNTTYTYCLAKIALNGNHSTISIWSPPVRESGSIDIYVGNCLNSGCRFLGPDYSYPSDPIKYILLRPADPYNEIYELNGNDPNSIRLIIPKSQ